VITIDDLEKYFADPFSSDPLSHKHRVALCARFKNWLLKLKSFEIPLEIWINGSFATDDAMPDTVNAVCVVNYYKKPLFGKASNEFNFLTQKRNAYIQKEYSCSIELPILNSKHIKIYNDKFLGDFQHYTNDGICSGIFKINL